MKKPFLAALAIVMVLAIGAGVLWSTPILSVKRFEVSGNARTSTEQIIEASQIAEGDNLVRIPAQAAGQRIIGLPWVVKVSVSRKLPNTVDIEVQEHEPLGYVQRFDGLHLFDDAGHEFLISDDPSGAVKVEVAQDDAASLQAAAELLAAVPAEQRARITAVVATSPTDLVTKLQGDRVVDWGSTEYLHDKVVAFRAALERPEPHVDISGAPTIAVR